MPIPPIPPILPTLFLSQFYIFINPTKYTLGLLVCMSVGTSTGTQEAYKGLH